MFKLSSIHIVMLREYTIHIIQDYWDSNLSYIMLHHDTNTNGYIGKVV